jgi:hypothetical protein
VIHRASGTGTISPPATTMIDLSSEAETAVATRGNNPGRAPNHRFGQMHGAFTSIMDLDHTGEALRPRRGLSRQRHNKTVVYGTTAGKGPGATQIGR